MYFQQNSINCFTGACSYEEIIDPNTSTSCKRHGEEVNCAGHLQPGTKATIHCRSGYQKPEGVNSELTCLATGKWSSPTFKCELICGKITSNSTALQVEG